MKSFYKKYPLGYFGISSTVLNFLIIINIIVFLIQTIAGQTFIYLFGLIPLLVLQKYYIWQILTYMFLHGGIFHLGFNLFTLWMFGRELETIWGWKMFLKYYLICGIGAGILTVLFSVNSIIPTIGASGAIFGILLAYAMKFPKRKVLLYFIIPVSAKVLVILFGIFELLACLSYTSDGIGHFAHLGGMLFGYIYLKMNLRFFPMKRKIVFPIRRKKMRVIAPKREKRESEIDTEVDRILDKISKEGMDSLTQEEMAKLKEASEVYNTQEDTYIHQP